MIALTKHLHLTQTQQPEDPDPPAPNPDARAETIRHNLTDTATLADKVLVAIARLLGRQAAREWFEAEG